MKAGQVIDAYSLIAYLEGEAGKDKVVELIKDARDTGRNLLLCVVNWGEVYYSIARESGFEGAEEAAKTIESLPIEIIPADIELTRLAARFKSSYKLSYGDCFALALAKLRKTELVTGDKEFKVIEKEVKINWIE
ncbi:MAG: type II toxin-antitoxin system VapC family toxin [Patescibacteria group bacterium]|nr:type II toxin-antitoxin system VapC family toxin [Patescibacteria group bacterium]